MKDRNVILKGQIGEDGELYIHNKSQLDSFCNQWPNKKVKIIVECNDPGTTDSIRGYYFDSIVPQFQKAFREIIQERLSKAETDLKLRKMCPVTFVEVPNEEGNGYDLCRVMGISEMDNSQFSEFINHIKQIGAEDYGVYIQDPRTVENYGV